MQLYWKCEECDETNAYPSVKICETCGTPMSAAAEQRVLREQKEEERRQAQIKKEQERRRREEERARQEAERKKQEALKAARQAEMERKRLAELEQKLKKKAAREAKFGSIYRKCSRFSSGMLRIFAVVAIILSVVLFVKNADRVKLEPAFERISNNIHSEYLAHTIVKENDSVQISPEDSDTNDGIEDFNEERSSRVLSKVGDRLSVTFEGVLSNIDNQFQYMKGTYTPGRNIVDLFEDIVEFLSEGVEK